MIKTDRYDGITKGAEEHGGVAWRVVGDNFVMNDEAPQPDGRYIAYVQLQNDGTHKVMEFSDADANLIADAPLILEAYKRLSKLEDVVREAFSEDSKYTSDEYMNKMGEILGVIER